MVILSAKHRSPAIVAGTKKAYAAVCQRVREAWKPRKFVPPANWAQAKIRLDRSVEAGGGNYDISRRPWWEDVLNDLADPEVRDICIPASTQVGKTMSLIASILWTAEHAPAPGMIVLPDKDTAIEMRDRIYGNAAMVRGCKRLRVPPEHLWNARYIDLGSMRIYLAWAGSRQRLRGRPCRYVWLSETDVYNKGDKKAGDPIASAHQRTKAFFRGLHYHESSPSSAPSRIYGIERQCSARYRWHGKCPHCGQLQELRFFTPLKGPHAGRGGFGGLKDSHGEWLPAEEAREQAFYICEQGCQIDNSDKGTFLELGKWVPLGEIKSRRSVGRQLWSIHSDTITFGDIAAAHIQHREKGKLAEFFGNWLGLEYSEEIKLPEWNVLGERQAGPHKRGTVPQEAWFLSAGADVQADGSGCRVVVRAWAPERTSWMVDWYWLTAEEADMNKLVRGDLEQIRQRVLEKSYPVLGVNPLGRAEMKTKLLCIDTNYRPKEVHRWMQSLPPEWTKGSSPRVRAIRGDSQIKADLRWRKSIVESNTRTGEEYEGGLEQWGLNVWTFYDDLTAKLLSTPGKPGAWYVPSDTLAQSDGKTYLEQVVNFARQTKVNPDTGEVKAFWGPRNYRIPVDYWDCEVYALVGADMIVGNLGWDAGAWETWRQNQLGAAAAAAAPVVTKERRPAGERGAGDLSDR